MVGADFPTSAVRRWYQGVCHVAGSCAPLPDAQPSSITSCRALASFSGDFQPERCGREKAATWFVSWGFCFINYFCVNFVQG